MVLANDLAPGAFVLCPAHPEWGIGQIQSILGEMATANFENAGKIVVNLSHVRLEPAEPGDPPLRSDPAKK